MSEVLQSKDNNSYYATNTKKLNGYKNHTKLLA